MLRTLLSELPGIWRAGGKLQWQDKGNLHLPGVLLRVEVDDGPEDHKLCAAALQQGHLKNKMTIETRLMCAQSYLILLTNPGEGGDLLRHLDDPLDRQVGQVDHAGKELVPLVGKDIHLIRLGSLMYLRKSTSTCYKRHSNRHKRSER